MKPEERPTPESSANAFVATKEFMPSKGVLVVPIETAQRLERQRDRLRNALKALIDAPDHRKLSEFSPEELAAWAEASDAIAEVEGGR